MEKMIIDTLGQLLQFLQIPFTGITVKQEGDIQRVNVDCTEPSRLIGWHGEALNAVQHLLKSVLRTMTKAERAPFIVVDVDGYRLMQEDKVRKIAEAKADFVRRTGARVTLSPMSPYFRRIVHMHVASTPALADLATESVGEGDYRQIVIRLKDESAVPGETSEELSPVLAGDGCCKSEGPRQGSI
jgi:spoIIIJ-associated protein